MYEDIISLENLFISWQEFLKGKKNRRDVMYFSCALSHNIYSLHTDLLRRQYTHGAYQAFNISDPKPRCIHKATIRDRLLHHTLCRILFPFFDKKFIFDSYSSRSNKGTHRAIDRFQRYFYGISKNNTKSCWVLKCDIRKFFASIDHDVLFSILEKYNLDQDTKELIQRIVASFNSGIQGKGLPLGNLTSQLLMNVYMNELDQYVKFCLKEPHYIRYADDFVVLSRDKKYLVSLVRKIDDFLKTKLNLMLHSDKVFLKTYSSGIDFLGWVHFSDHRILRISTKRKILKRVKSNPRDETIASYAGLLKHGNTQKLLQEIQNKPRN